MLADHRLAYRARTWCTLAAVVALAASLAAPAWAGNANAGIPGAPKGNPLAGLPWGTYSGSLDEVFPAYRSASGRNRGLLARIALAARVRWYGPWISEGDAEQAAASYVQGVTQGRADVLAQVAVFRLSPWEGAACRRAPSASEQASYRQWIDGFARGLGDARVALILQPDLPMALCAPRGGRVALGLVVYAARVFSRLSHTTVYIDVGAADWPSVRQAVSLLRAAGVRSARGFALNATHYDSTERQILFGQRVVRGLAAAGIGGRHFVVNTAQNGRPFRYQDYGGASYDNAPACRSRAQRRCVTLGIPPTTQVASRRWGLSGRARSVARRLVDGYLWMGRPWLYNQNNPFDLRRALALAATTPF